MRKVIDTLFLGALAIFVLGILGLTWLGRNNVSDSYENRRLDPLPTVEMDKLLDGTLVSEVDSWATDHLKGRSVILKLLTALKAEVLHLPVVSDVVITEERLLGFNEYGRWDTAYLNQQTEAVATEIGHISQQVSAYGGVLYYVGVPEQYSYFSDRYPSYLENRQWLLDISWEAMDQAFLQADVRFINGRDYFASLGSPDSFYSATDHHYAFYGALALAGHMIDRIHEETGEILWKPSAETLDITELPNPYMGSRSRRLYGILDYGERAAVGVPKDPVEFVRYDNGQKVEAEVFAYPETETQTISYTLYMGNDFGETVIQTNRPELPSVLIVGESFTNAIESVIYPAFDEMRSLDLRYYDEMTLDAYIELHKPDYVFIIRDDTAFLNALT